MNTSVGVHTYNFCITYIYLNTVLQMVDLFVILQLSTYHYSIVTCVVVPKSGLRPLTPVRFQIGFSQQRIEVYSFYCQVCVRVKICFPKGQTITTVSLYRRRDIQCTCSTFYAVNKGQILSNILNRNTRML